MSRGTHADNFTGHSLYSPMSNTEKEILPSVPMMLREVSLREERERELSQLQHDRASAGSWQHIEGFQSACAPSQREFAAKSKTLDTMVVDHGRAGSSHKRKRENNWDTMKWCKIQEYGSQIRQYAERGKMGFITQEEVQRVDELVSKLNKARSWLAECVKMAPSASSSSPTLSAASYHKPRRKPLAAGGSGGGGDDSPLSDTEIDGEAVDSAMNMDGRDMFDAMPPHANSATDYAGPSTLSTSSSPAGVASPRQSSVIALTSDQLAAALSHGGVNIHMYADGADTAKGAAAATATATTGGAVPVTVTLSHSAAQMLGQLLSGQRATTGDDTAVAAQRPPRVCVKCGATKTSTWRRSPEGMMCNSCGLKVWRHNRQQKGQKRKEEAAVSSPPATITTTITGSPPIMAGVSTTEAAGLSPATRHISQSAVAMDGNPQWTDSPSGEA